MPTGGSAQAPPALAGDVVTVALSVEDGLKQRYRMSDLDRVAIAPIALAEKCVQRLKKSSLPDLITLFPHGTTVPLPAR
jgi:hypothetical protein